MLDREARWSGCTMLKLRWLEPTNPVSEVPGTVHWSVEEALLHERPSAGGAVWPALFRLRRSHTAGMQSKVHPTYQTKYRVANWPAYNRALVRRGDVTVWLSSEEIAAWTPCRSGRRGGQRRYSDLAIETTLTLRLLYHLPLRQAAGFLHALFGMMRLDLSAPDYTTLSRRRLRLVPTDEGLHLVLDSTGLSIVGEGEWAAAKHGGRGRRGWRKLHLGVDQSGVIRVHTLTEATGDDATTALDLLTAVEGPLVRVELDPISWTRSERWRRCPEWQQPHVGGHAGNSVTSSGLGRSGWCWKRGRRSAPSPASWILPNRPCGNGSSGRAPTAAGAVPV